MRTYNFDLLVLIDEYVFWFKVSVHYLMVKALLQTFNYRRSEIDGNPRVEFALLRY